MKSKIRIKKKYVVSILTLIIPIVIAILIMNGGYSIWSSKLNISGKVHLEKEETKLSVVPLVVENGRYINYSGFEDNGTAYFSWRNDSYYENNMSSNIQVKNDSSDSKNISISFKLRNDSTQGITYKNGTIMVDKKVDSGNAIKSNSYSISKTELNAGDTTTVQLNYTIQTDLINNGTYIKYLIKYDVEESFGTVPYYYYYTLYLAPQN